MPIDDQQATTTDTSFGKIFTIAASFFGMGVLIAAIDEVLEAFFHFTVLGKLGPKLLTAAFLSFFGLVVFILKEQRATLDGLRKSVIEILQTEAKGLLRGTLVESILVGAVGAADGGARHHEKAVHFLKALAHVDAKLAPGVEVVAQRHIDELENSLRWLQNDTDKFEIRGDYQIRIADAFSKNCKEIVFFDMELPEWSLNFSHYMHELKGSSMHKVQYLGRLASECANINSNKKLASYIQKLSGFGFDVFLIPLDAFNATDVCDLNWRYEIYDSAVVLKIRSMKSFANAIKEDLDITLRTVGTDPQTKTILETLKKHGTKVPCT